MSLIMHKGQQIAGGGLGVLKLTKAQYEANQTWYDSSEFLICITDLDPNNVNEDTIIDQGISNNWTYRKWASGIAECWYNKIISQTLTFASTSDAKSIPAIMGNEKNYPFTFVEAPQIVGSVLCVTSQGYGLPVFATIDSLNTSVGGFLWSSYALTATQVSLSLSVKGLWKAFNS